MLWKVLAVLSLVTTSASALAAGDAAKGQVIVNNVCIACHAADGNSVISANPKLAGQHADYINKQLTNFKSGDRKNAVMTGIATALSPEDMQNVAAYFSANKMTYGKAKENGKGSLGEKIYRGGILGKGVPACASCHGATGSGLPPQFPRLAGQHSEYLVNQLNNFYKGERANDAAKMMRTIAGKMSEAEMTAVADYIQGLR